MPAPSCYAKAVELLAARPHFRAELAAKLAQRGYPEEEVEAALDRLVRERFLDDAKTARDFVEHRRETHGEGRRRLAAELARRGAPDAAADEALAGLTPDDDLAAAQAAAAAWARRGGTDPRTLARHLERKGFSRRAIFTVLNEHSATRREGEVGEAWEEAGED